MIDAATLAQMNGEYVMLPGAGPAWRTGAEGIDLSLLKNSLAMTAWERMRANDDALNFGESLRAAMAKRNAELK